MRSKKGTVYEFDCFKFDPRRRRLLERGGRVSVHPKALDLLLVLLENRDRAMSKEEIMQALWPNTVVDESNLTQNVFQLRRALRDDAHEHRHIVTLHGSGYRFVSDVRAVAAAGTSFSQEGWSKATENEGDRAARSIAVLPLRPLSSDPTDEYGSGNCGGTYRQTLQPPAIDGSADRGHRTKGAWATTRTGADWTPIGRCVDCLWDRAAGG